MKRLEQQEIEKIVWKEKYRQPGEDTFEETNYRVCRGVYKDDLPNTKEDSPPMAAALEAMNKREWCPAGRIHAGAGTDKDVTWINCFVSPTIEDSIATTNPEDKNVMGIMEALKVATRTQQMEGGIGMDFSTLRPRGALISTRRTAASGPVSFMNMWNAMGGTMEQSNRRGAMMATLACDHPDVLEFIEAKHEANSLTNFNVSVLITDLFMDAVKNDLTWSLTSTVPRLDGKHEGKIEHEDETIYIYKTLPARELFDKIIKSTYYYAEPGVIFIDRINEWNNLWYCEDIRATNPCGEQPLPPNGACNLGANNLAVMVENPFTDRARLKLDRIAQVTRIAMRFLDNVLDQTKYPTPEQHAESMAKRRTGLGITGLGNMLQQMGIRYGSAEAVKVTESVMRTIRDNAYLASIELAKERGPFPLFNKELYMKGRFIQTLPQVIRDQIEKHGIRNGVLMTVAPTGTTSIYYGNVSSGLEPTFAWSYKRKMRQSDGSFKEFTEVQDYGFRLYKHVMEMDEFYYPDPEELPDYMVTAQDLAVRDHLTMQSACQKFIDASTSKTINCPEDMTFDDFVNVYYHAYEAGLKGCTTYRPSEIGEKVRGSILSVDDKPAQEKKPDSIIHVVDRPVELYGKTYKVKWPGSEHAMYITVNDFINEDGTIRPFEVFINTKDARHQEWIMALTRCISAIFRRGGDVSFIIEELKAVHSSVDGGFIEGKYVPSLVAKIGLVLENHIASRPAGPVILKTDLLKDIKLVGGGYAVADEKEEPVTGQICPKCAAPTFVHQEGCNTCLSCGYSDCG